MASTRRNYRLTSNEITEFLCDDEDSDVDSCQDEDIEETVADLRETLEAQEEIYDDDKSSPIIGPQPETQRGRTVERRGQRVLRGRRQRQRGRVATSTRDSTRNLQVMNEAAGWSYTSRQQPPDNPVFEQQSKILVPDINENSNELDCFLVFYPDSFWKLLKTETNRYAGQMKAKQARQGLLKPGSMLHSWKPVTLIELKKFISIIIHMTLVNKESIDTYWSTKEIIHTPFAGKVMTRARFRAIYSCLHLNDNLKYIPRGHPNYDAFFKLRPYFDELCQLCENSFYPKEELTIDEGTCGFRGRIHFKVFNKDKPEKYGMKIYMLCDAETGYILRMIPYVGDSKRMTQIVTELTEPYLDKWHTVYMDRFFTSPTVADLFWLRNTRIVGTVMSNRRGLPQHWRQQPLDTNEMTFCHRANLTACKWKDKRDVNFLTTKHGATWTEVTIKAKGGPIKKNKPDCILDYNLHKIGVDLNDQYVSYYSFHRKTMKWWKKMFFHLMARAMVNAYIIHNKSRQHTRKQRFSQFLTSCGEALLDHAGSAGPENAAAGPSHGQHFTGSSTRLIGRHFHRRIPPTEKKENVKRVCKVCADIIKKQTGKRGRKETSWYCPDCNVPLCHEPCFEKYHTRKDYTA